MTLKPLGDSAWLVEFPEKSGLEALALVKGYLAALGQDRPAGVLDVVPAFASLAVHFEGENGLISLTGSNLPAHSTIRLRVRNL